MRLMNAGDKVLPQFCNAWIAPNGAFYYVPVCGHIGVAAMFGMSDTMALRQGWMQVTLTPISVYSDNEPTMAQYDTLQAMVDNANYDALTTAVTEYLVYEGWNER